MLATQAWLLGCTSRATLPVVKPAEHSIQHLEKLAILDLDGPENSGKLARAALITAFFENKHYELIDQTQLARVAPITLEDGRISLPAAMNAASQLGVDAVIVGQVVSYSVVDDKHKDSSVSSANLRERGFSSGAFGVGTDTTETITRDAVVTLAVQLVDVKQGTIQATRKTTHNFTGKFTAGQGDLPNHERILDRLMANCCRDVVGMLCPHRSSIEETLATQRYGRGFSSVRKGNASAVDGDWPAAEAAWLHAIKSNPDNHHAMHNLALAAEARQNYPESLLWMDRALAKSSTQAYIATRGRIQDRKQTYLQAFAQTQSKQEIQQIRALAAKQSLPLPNAKIAAEAPVIRLPTDTATTSYQTPAMPTHQAAPTTPPSNSSNALETVSPQTDISYPAYDGPIYR